MIRLRRGDSYLQDTDSVATISKSEDFCFEPWSLDTRRPERQSFLKRPQTRFVFLCTVLVLVLCCSANIRFKSRMDSDTNTLRGTIVYRNKNRTGSISVAHLGNSIQYFNDCPRFLEHMLNEKYEVVNQDSCLRGGANVTGLYDKGNGMEEKFATPNAKKPDGTYDVGSPTVDDLLAPDRKWDYVVINDHTQAPVREESKNDSIQAFQEHYIPLIGDEPTVILLMTAAYKEPVKNSTDLGGFEHFTDLLVKGYAEYAKLFQKAKIAPLGLAYQYIKHHHGDGEWAKLYAPDDFHPSPHGTLLEASILFCTITGERPPDYNQLWWKTARYMQPPSVQPPMPLPTEQEAEFIREVAVQVCNVTVHSAL